MNIDLIGPDIDAVDEGGQKGNAVVFWAIRPSFCRSPRRARSAGAALTDREAVSTGRCRRGPEAIGALG